ncbi:hypothetical protein SUGI_1088380 [Cryptomeria japonica]|uniref:uncharacterized protein LOC131026978 n=1 Tax=Cryptomeria japonica TaxID=3369 RepID=UPI00241477C4|nr:uncharacterized protein LOC131026978 [Cryptomeria japonica]GLJ51128.1 hypothetical protein SUGI_1088380 [Cryptomeria japonica]
MGVIFLNSPTNKFIPNNNFQFCPKKLILSQGGGTRKIPIYQCNTIINANNALRISYWNLPSWVLKPYKRKKQQQCEVGGNGTSNSKEDGSDDAMDEAIHMDDQIPETSDKFVKRVSSRAYDIRRQLKQSIESSSYDVLEANPWREDSKPVYVLAQGENQLWTMRTRRARSEVERELGILFPKQGNKRTEIGSQLKKSDGDTRFRMLVEDVREGVLVFEDEEDAAKYCNLLEGHHGQGCAGVAQLDASSVFDLCKKMKALAVFFRRGRSHPLPDNLELDLKARKRSLEDQE